MTRSLMAPAVTLLALAVGAGCSKSSPSSGESTASSAAPTAVGPVQGVASAIKNAIAPSSQPFEGDVNIRVVEASRPTPEAVSLQLKADKIRFNANANGAGGPMGSGILRLKDKKMITIIDAQKKYVEIDFGGAGPGAMRGPGPTGAGTNAVPSAPPKIDKTGHHETIAGHDCEDWNLESNGRKALVCMASDLGTFDFGSLEGHSFVPDFVKHEIFGSAAAFPLKLVDYDATGKEKTHVEVTHIEHKTEDDSVFEPPAGYTKLDMGNLGALGGFGGHVPPHAPTP
jgi:hypothetical protein